MITEILKTSYLDCLSRSELLLKKVPAQLLFHDLGEGKRLEHLSVGYYLLRSAGALEQVVGGMTRRLWDDPFEWTLPEALASHDAIERYLSEVRDSVISGFSIFTSDAELLRDLPAPVKIKPIAAALIEALSLANERQGRAIAIFDALK